jgi:hypothetical protein
MVPKPWGALTARFEHCGRSTHREDWRFPVLDTRAVSRSPAALSSKGDHCYIRYVAAEYEVTSRAEGAIWRLIQ